MEATPATSAAPPPGPPLSSSHHHQDLRRRLPDFLQSVSLRHVKLGYHYLTTHLLPLLLLPLAFSLLLHLLRSPQLLPAFSLSLAGSLLLLSLHLITRPRPILLLDFSCHLPNPRLRATTSEFLRHSSLSGAFLPSSLDFQKKVLLRSGLGEETCVPAAMHDLPPSPSVGSARLEAEEVIFSSLDSLFSSTSTSPRDVGILVVNCSLFNPTPSLSAMIVHRYKLRGSILSFNLGGMGCSAGLISVALARDLLLVHRNTLALVVSTENITQNWYFGNRRDMLIPNCLFRVGAAAVLLSNRISDRRRAKYRLLHVVRTHRGADDRSFRCVYQQQDDEGKVGVSLSKDLMAVAGEALKTNITTLGPLVLPLSEQLLFFASLAARRLLRGAAKVKPYIPDFKLAFDHFCIHAGGRAVIDELERNLQLRPDHVEASRMTLHRFGNTSSSSIWYELAYHEAKERVRHGHRVWQIAFGSGFKCNSAVWQACRDVRPTTGCNPWLRCIDRYPVELVDAIPVSRPDD